jgi:uncharacterized protein (DUF362 family)/Pyruvate/2-oxoacid:ferredoxin oxidoreductase delta subunit
VLAGWDPSRAVTTHPAVVEGTIRALERRGARVWVGDNPGAEGYGKAGRSAEGSGMRAVAGERWVDMARHPVEVAVKSRHFERLVVSREVLDADLVVNLPKLKTHTLTTITGALKNMFGILVGAQKTRVHSACPRPADFADALLDVYCVRPPELTIMDGIVGLEGNGPTAGRPRSIGRLIVSEDGAAVDAVFAAMIGISPARVGMLRAARERGLGCVDTAAMRIEGEIPLLRRFRLPVTVVGDGIAGRLSAVFMMSRYGTPRFGVRAEACTRCGACARACPRGAIGMEGLPRWDLSRCIGCYCCFELCEARAVRLGGPLAALFGR